MGDKARWSLEKTERSICTWLLGNGYVFYLKMDQPWSLFVYFCSFQTQILQKKLSRFQRIRTWIVGIKGKHTDHLTTAHWQWFSY